MRKIPLEVLILTALVMLAIGLIIGFLIGIDTMDRPVIVLDTSHEATLDKACLYNGIEKADYILYSGHSFMRDGQRCALFNNAVRSEFAQDWVEEQMEEK